MTHPDTVREALRWQAAYCDRNGAPITGRICTALADILDETSATGARALGWAGHPIMDALPLRLAGPFHALVRSGRGGALDAVYRGEVTAADAVAEAVRGALQAHDAEICGWLDGPPQTNEAARSGVLMAGLLTLAARFGPRFELLEIGSSAGLNLMIDRYRFDLGGVTVGPPDAAIRIAPEWRGPPPPDGPVRIERVRGVDIAPIDLNAPGQAERLMAYVWVDQADRLARTARAIALAQANPPMLERGDAADWVEARLAEPQEAGVTRVLMHSVVWQYLPQETQQRIEAAMATAGAAATEERPLGRVAYESDRSDGQHVLTVRRWPGGGATESLALAHPHGTWIEWIRGS
jgi:hypothetical protein